MGIAQLSDVAFMKKFAKCGDWFKCILENLKVEELVSYEKPKSLESYRIVEVDASVVIEKGATKRRFKLHYGIDLFTLSISSHQLTTESTGESLRNFNIQPKDLVLGDRAYGTKTSIEWCLDVGADFIFRIKNKAFKLYDENRNEVSVLSFLKTADEEKANETTVYMINGKKELVPMRLCAIKKSADEIKKAQKKLKRKESKGQCKFTDETKLTHQFVFVITSLPTAISSDEILSIYRLRWQVELYFKRLKSIMSYGDLPKKNEASMLAWLNGKLLVALLVERVLAEAVFSPEEQEHSEKYLA